MVNPSEQAHPRAPGSGHRTHPASAPVASAPIVNRHAQPQAYGYTYFPQPLPLGQNGNGVLPSLRAPASSAPMVNPGNQAQPQAHGPGYYAPPIPVSSAPMQQQTHQPMYYTSPNGVNSFAPSSRYNVDQYGRPVFQAPGVTASGTAAHQGNYSVNSNGPAQYWGNNTTSPWPHPGPRVNHPNNPNNIASIPPYPSYPASQAAHPVTTMSQGGRGRGQHAPGNGFNGGAAPQPTPPATATTAGDAAGVGPVPQPKPKTRHDLPPSPPSKKGKRRANSLPSQQAAKKQKPAAELPALQPLQSTPSASPATPGSQKAPSRLMTDEEEAAAIELLNSWVPPEPFYPDEVTDPGEKDSKDDSVSVISNLNLSGASQVGSGLQQPSAPARIYEPEHLPEYIRDFIVTNVIIEPDPSVNVPVWKKNLTWSEAYEKIEVLLKTATFGHILRPLAEFQELSDAMELFVARPGRRPLTAEELEQLLTVRYARVMEEGIALTELDLYTWRDWNIETTEVKEKYVKDAWEKRDKKHREDGPSRREVQMDLVKRYRAR